MSPINGNDDQGGFADAESNNVCLTTLKHSVLAWVTINSKFYFCVSVFMTTTPQAWHQVQWIPRWAQAQQCELVTTTSDEKVGLGGQCLPSLYFFFSISSFSLLILLIVGNYITWQYNSATYELASAYNNITSTVGNPTPMNNKTRLGMEWGWAGGRGGEPPLQTQVCLFFSISLNVQFTDLHLSHRGCCQWRWQQRQ